MNFENETIDYLASLEFEEPELRKEIIKSIHSGRYEFSIKHSLLYGEEKMIFDLQFKKDFQFDAYQFIGYKATHIGQLDISHKTIGGIDTSKLEQRMKIEDWDSWFKGDGSSLDANHIQYIQEIIDMLNHLPASEDVHGLWIQERLMYKYWPFDLYDHPSKSEMRHAYEKSLQFRHVESGISNAHLAYHVVSGHFVDLCHNRLGKMGLERFPRIDVYTSLEQILSENPQQFDLSYWFNDPEGFCQIQIGAYKGKDCFDVETYSFSLTPHPRISHGIHQGIDTSRTGKADAAG